MSDTGDRAKALADQTQHAVACVRAAKLAVVADAADAAAALADLRALAVTALPTARQREALLRRAIAYLERRTP